MDSKANMTCASGKSWVLYGAYGYVGQLMLAEALKLGLRPILAGRAIGPLRALAKTHGLPWRLLVLGKAERVNAGLQDIDLLVNVAGPFLGSAKQLIDSAIATGTHYLDVSSELPSVRYSYTQHSKASAAGVALVAGAGITPLGADCLANYLLHDLDTETRQSIEKLEVGIASLKRKSLGSLRTLLKMADRKGQVRREHQAVPERLAKRIRRVEFSQGTETLVSLPLAEIDTLHWHYRIPSITAYSVQPLGAAKFLQLLNPSGYHFLRSAGSRLLKRTVVAEGIHGPTSSQRDNERSHIWCCITDRKGIKKQVCVETIDGYSFTAIAAAKVVAELLKTEKVGALTPAQLLGPDFLLSMPQTMLYGSLRELPEIEEAESVT